MYGGGGGGGGGGEHNWIIDESFWLQLDNL